MHAVRRGLLKSFPLRGRCRRRRRKRCRTEKRSASTDAKAERRPPLPSSGLRETPDATLPSRGGIFTRSPFRWTRKRNEVHPQVLPLEGKVSPQATEEVSYRKALCFAGCESETTPTSPVIRLAGDAGCPPPLKGRDFTRSPLRQAQKRNEFHPVLPLEGKVSPQATEEVSYRIAGCFDGCRSATIITSSVIRLAGDAGCHPPLKGRDFARSPLRRAQKQNENHLFRHPACGGRRMPPSPRGEGFIRAARSDGGENGTKSTPKSFPLRGRCRRRRRKRCRTEKRSASTAAKAERRLPLPSSGLRETTDAAPARGGIFRASIRPRFLSNPAYTRRAA